MQKSAKLMVLATYSVICLRLVAGILWIITGVPQFEPATEVFSTCITLLVVLKTQDDRMQ